MFWVMPSCEAMTGTLRPIASSDTTSVSRPVRPLRWANLATAPSAIWTTSWNDGSSFDSHEYTSAISCVRR